jgi:hypothetical protein
MVYTRLHFTFIIIIIVIIIITATTTTTRYHLYAGYLHLYFWKKFMCLGNTVLQLFCSYYLLCT